MSAGLVGFLIGLPVGAALLAVLLEILRRNVPMPDANTRPANGLWCQVCASEIFPDPDTSFYDHDGTILCESCADERVMRVTAQRERKP
ncbi:MAG: hypothetical protein ACYDBH_24400 [Acidobacteriaceae bacterium]